MRRLCALVWLIAHAIAPARAEPPDAETFDNASVIALTRAGLGSEIIVAKVAGLPCGYDLSTAGLLALRQAGVAEPVMVAMMHRCAASSAPPDQASAAAHPGGRPAPGLYLASGGSLIQLRPAASVGIKVTGNGSLLFPHRTTLTVARPHAQQTVAELRPRFLFAFDPADDKVNTFGTAISEAAQSPGEFSLVRFRPDGNTRQLVIGRGQPYLDVSGIDPRVALPFAIVEEGQGLFRVSPDADLVPGDYGFVLVGESPRNRTFYRIFDFTVAPAATRP